MYKNLKIAITDETHLRSVCDVLESMGYINTFRTNKTLRTICTWSHNGSYGITDLSLDFCFFQDEVNLSDLLKMRDDMVKANANKDKTNI